MKSIYFSLAVLLVLCLSFQCSPKDGESICYEFDQRQCAGDEWADIVPINDSKEDREKKMEAYLKSQKIEVKDVRLVIGFHEAVCEACNVCPEEDRFFIKIDEEDEGEFTKLNLLNSNKIDCGDVF